MSGHSHWATIKHKKGAIDAKRGKLWSKLSRAIIIAARHGGGDPTMNLKLRYAIYKARAVSMPKDNIERAVKRGTGEIEGVTYDEILYEARGPGGVAFLVEVMTDNRNRTNGEIKKLRTAYAAMAEASEDGSLDKYLQADVEFHQGILAACHNEMVEQLASVLRNVFRITFSASASVRVRSPPRTRCAPSCRHTTSPP